MSRETFGTGSPGIHRGGQCYRLAALAQLRGAPEGTALVHGLLGADFRHAWLVLPDGRVWEPVTCDFDPTWMQGATEVGRFTAEQTAARLATGCFDWWAEMPGQLALFDWPLVTA